MLNEAVAHLAEWVRAAADPVAVDGEAPGPNTAEADERLSCYLYAVTPREPLRGLHRHPLQLDLDFLVTATAASAGRVNELMSRVLGAAAARTDVELLPPPQSADFWRAFGVPPRPALAVRTVSHIERQTSVAPPVRNPLIVSSGPLVRVTGRVLATSGIPVAAAEVRVPGHPTIGWTDAEGRFSFTALPPTAEPRRFLVRARGRRFELSGNGPDDNISLLIDPTGIPDPTGGQP